MLILAPSLILDSRSDKIISDWLSGFPELNLVFLPYQKEWSFENENQPYLMTFLSFLTLCLSRLYAFLLAW